MTSEARTSAERVRRDGASAKRLLRRGKISARKTLGVLVVLLLVCPGLVFSQAQKGKVKYRLNVGVVVTETDPMYKGALEFKKNVEARTNGEIAIGVYPNSLLGDTKDMQEQVKAGANVAVITDAARLAESVPAIGILGAPYIVDGAEEESDWRRRSPAPRVRWYPHL